MNFSLRPLGVNGGQSVDVDSGYLSIGRARACGLQLDHSMVSRHHAELVVHDNRVLVRDLESSNGTYVNGEPVHNVRRLQDGDVVSFAVIPFEIRIEIGIRDRIRQRSAARRLSSLEGNRFGDVESPRSDSRN